MIPPQARLFRIYLNASLRREGKPLYQAVVQAARGLHLAGASVFLVDLCFGMHRRLRDAKSEYLFVDIPVVVEIVDAPEKIGLLETRLAPMVADGFATVEPVRVVRYAHHGPVPGVASPADTAGDEHDTPHPFPPGRTTHMPLEGEAQRLTVYIGSSDTWHGRNLATEIVDRCRKLGIAGATASLGVMGSGKSSRIHRAHLLGLSEDLPERIEIVDSPAQLVELLPILEVGLIIRKRVHTIRYGHHAPDPA